MTLHYYIIGGTILAGIIALIPIFYILAPIYPWTYTNARIKTMQKKMIENQDIEGYLIRPYEDIIYDLEEKFIPNFSKYLSADFTYAAVDNALRQHFIQTVKKLIRITPTQQNDFLRTYLTRFEIRTLKNTIRTLSDAGTNQQTYLAKTTLFSESFKKNKDFTLENIERELQGTPYQHILEKHRTQIKNQDYLDFETDLNKLYLKKLRNATTSSYAKRYVKKNIDKLNIQTWIKKGETYVKGGYISTDAYHTENYTQLKEAFSKKGYILPSKKQEVEQYMKQNLLTLAQNLRSKDPHSEASTISYLIQKAHKIQQLNILLKLKYHKTPKEKIRKALQL